ncbi:MAG: glycosyl hydrolase [Nibricoccus sp.]
MPPSYSNAEPVNPGATPEARELLTFLQSVNGHGTLSGQHNYFSMDPLSSDRVEALTGVAPRVWGCEWGFSDARHPTDDIAYRPRLLEEMRVRYEAGYIVVLTWHQASPTMGEPCLFEEGVKMNLSDRDWREILTEGTDLNRIWCEQVDLLARGLCMLRDAKVPVIFRPYHEMNGNWFWWGGRPGSDDYQRLWSMLQDRLIRHHRLDNLLWAWCSDRPWEGVEDYWPGHDRVDILGADIYPLSGNPVVFRPEWFDRMSKLAAGKPLALTENSVLPTEEELQRQPWAWFMGWVDLMFDANTGDRIREVYRLPRVISGRRNIARARSLNAS